MVNRQRRKDIHDVWIDWYSLRNTRLIGNQDGLTGILAFEWGCHIDWQPICVNWLIIFRIGIPKYLTTNVLTGLLGIQYAFPK